MDEKNNIDSILTSVKVMLGITEEYEHFDAPLIMHINSVLGILTQLGVGPKNGFSISGKGEVWEDFLGDETLLEMVKSYAHLKVKLLFDPPLSSVVVEAMNRMASELEWRIHVTADTEIV